MSSTLLLAAYGVMSLPGVAAGALEIQMPDRVAYVYSVREAPGATRPSVYCTYLRHMIVDSKPITVQVGQAALWARLQFRVVVRCV
jgi:hypothetical protein